MTYSDAAFEAVTDEIEELYADLRGIEAVSDSILFHYKQMATGEEEVAPGTVTTYIPYVMPTRSPFTVHPALTLADDSSVQANLDEIFELGKAGAGGTGSWMRYLIDDLYLTDPKAIVAAANKQQDALTHLMGRFIDDFASIETYLVGHWKGGSSDSFRTWYGHVDDVMAQLVYFGSVAKVGAGGTADAIRTAQDAAMAVAIGARDALEDVLSKWREEASSFPARPGVGDIAMKEFKELLSDITKYAELIPVKQIQAGLGAIETTGEIFSTAFDLLGEPQPENLTIPPLSPDLITMLDQQLTGVAKSFRKAVDELGVETGKNLDEISTRGFLLLDKLGNPRHPNWDHKDQ